MAEKFNPLSTWLGVTAPKPSYYQLLGLQNFESEPPVIAEAADGAIAKVQAHLRGSRREQAEKLIRDLTTVKGLLLSADKRRGYDEQLRKQLMGGSSSKLGSPPAPHPISTLPQAVEAADSPTMMLPPGALGAALSGTPMQGLPPGYSQPGYPAPGYPPGAPPGALPPGALPAGAYAQAPGGLPLPVAGAPMHPAAMQMPPGYPPYAAGGIPTAAAPVPLYNYGPGGGAGEAPVAVAAHPAAAYSEPAFAPKTSTVRVRAANARKQQQSNVTVALAVLGVAAVVLIVVIVVANRKKAEQHPNENNVALASNPAHDTMNPPLPTATLPGPSAVPPKDAVAASLGQAFPGAMNPGTTVNVAEELDPRERSMMRNGGRSPTVPTTPTTTTDAIPAEKPAVPLLRGVTVEPVYMEASLPEDAARAKSVPTMLSAARNALRSREYAKAEEIILQAQITADSPTLLRLTLDHMRALDLIQGFWTSVRDGIKTLKEGDELTFNAKTAIVVRHDEVNLFVKQDNKEIPLVIEKLLPALAVQLAERALPKDAGPTKLVVGMFLSLDQSGQDGDHEKGRALVEEAAQIGVDVTDLRSIVQAP